MMKHIFTHSLFSMAEPTLNRRGISLRSCRKQVKRPWALWRPQLLFIEDDMEIINVIKIISYERSWPISIAQASSDALALLARKHFDAIILDWKLPDFNGNILLELSDLLISKHYKNRDDTIGYPTPIVTFSSESTKTVTLPEVKNFFHMGHWAKPLSFNQLRDNFEQLVYGRQGLFSSRR